MNSFINEEAIYAKATNVLSNTVEEDSTDYRLHIELFRLCRVCGLTHNQEVVTIYGDDGVELQLEEKINNYLPITVSIEDELPLHVCHSCVEKLNFTHELIVSCLDANARFCRYQQSKDVKDLLPAAASPLESQFLTEIEVVQAADEFTVDQSRSTELMPISETSVDEQLSVLSPKDDTKSEKAQEVSEDLPTLKKVVVLKLIHSKKKNLSPSARIAKALEYLKSKKRKLGIAESSTSSKLTMGEPALNELYGVSKTDESGNFCSSSKLKNDVTGIFLNHTEKSYNTQQPDHNITKCPTTNTDAQINSNSETLEQIDSNFTGSSAVSPVFYCNDKEICQISGIPKSSESCTQVSDGHCTNMREMFKISSVNLAKALDYIKSKRILIGMSGSSDLTDSLAVQHPLYGLSYNSKLDEMEASCSLTQSAFTSDKQNIQSPSKTCVYDIKNNFDVSKCLLSSTCNVENDSHIMVLQQGELKGDTRSNLNSPLKKVNPDLLQNLTTQADIMSLQKNNKDYGASNEMEIEDRVEVASIAEFCVRTVKEGQIITSESPKLESEMSKALGAVDTGTKKQIIQVVHNIISSGKEDFSQPVIVRDKYKHCKKCGARISGNEEVNIHVCPKKSLTKHLCGFVCNVCKKQFKDIYKYIIHKQIHLRSSSYNCPKCNKEFSQRYSLQLHQMSHRNMKPHKCKHCEKRFRLRASLEIHKAHMHSDRKTWLCDQCGERFAHKYNLNIHVRNHRSDNVRKYYKCKLCNKLFHKHLSLNHHLKSHIDEQSFDCLQCNKNFSTKEKLIQHESVHLHVHPYQCSICSLSFIRKGNLTKHYKTHATEKIVTCRICRATFPSVAGLLNHRKSHSSDKPDVSKSEVTVEGETSLTTAENYQCTVCNKILSSKLSLSLHMRVHTGEKPYQCEVCSKRFTQKPALTYHMRLHTGERPHACQFCGKGFNSKVGKESHERIHTGERPYKCGQCGTGFRCSANLRQHSWIHTDNRPFVCDVCNKLFRRREALQVHMRIHTGERPYSCPICGRSFTQKGDMLKHTRSHSKRNDRVPSLACLYCGQVFNQKKYHKMHMEKCNITKENTSIKKQREQEALTTGQEKLIHAKEEAAADIKSEELGLQEISTVTLTSDDIIITLPEITIVTDDIEEFEVQYQ